MGKHPDSRQASGGGEFSASPKPRWAVAVGKRTVMGVGAVVTVLATGLTLCAELRRGSRPQPGDHPPAVICSNAAGTRLTADVDADGRLDEIRDPYRSGGATVVFSRATTASKTGVGEALTSWQRLKSVSTPGMHAQGAFGDFDADGYLDLALFYSQDDDGDEPRANLPVHEVRYGPLARDLSGTRTSTIDMRRRTFVAQVRATDRNHDGRAELQLFQSAGDGGYDRFTGRRKDGTLTLTPDPVGFYGSADMDDFEGDWRDFGVCAYPAS